MFALLAVAATPAQAALRSGSIGWEAPATPPSLEPRPPETQANEYIDTVAVAYEDQAGHLS